MISKLNVHAVKIEDESTQALARNGGFLYTVFGEIAKRCAQEDAIDLQADTDDITEKYFGNNFGSTDFLSKTKKNR